jgi:hypothetical protein
MRLPVYAIAILASASVGTACFASERSFSKRSWRVRVGCEDISGTQVQYRAPLGWRIVRYDTEWVGLSGVGHHTAIAKTNSRERPTRVVAKGMITGRDREAGVGVFGRRIESCPTGGHGWLQVAGVIAR